MINPEAVGMDKNSKRKSSKSTQKDIQNSKVTGKLAVKTANQIRKV